MSTATLRRPARSAVAASSHTHTTTASTSSTSPSLSSSSSSSTSAAAPTNNSGSSNPPAAAAASCVVWFKRIGLIVLIVLSLTSIILGIASIDDTDPLHYYQILRLPIGVPQRVTRHDVNEGHSLVMNELASSMKQHGCNDIGEWELQVADDSDICAQLRSKGDHANEAHNVLSHPNSKYDYDTQGERKDYYSILEVTRDSPLEEVRSSYQQLTQQQIQLSEQFKCDRFGGTVPSAEERLRHATTSQTMPTEHSPESTESTTTTTTTGDGLSEEDLLKNGRRRCLHIKRRRSELNEAVLVIGDEASRAVYTAGDQKPNEGLQFVSQPLAMVQTSTNPLRFLLPLFVVFGVVYVLTQMNPPQVTMHESTEHDNDDTTQQNDEEDDDGDNDDHNDASHHHSAAPVPVNNSNLS